MIYPSISKTCLVSLLLTNTLCSFAGAMGDVSTDSKRFFFSAAPIYGSLSDEGINKLDYVDTVNDGAMTGNLPHISSRWGYSLALGYQFGPEQGHDLVLSYTNLTNRGSNIVANTNLTNDLLINRLSQIVRREDSFANPGNTIGGQELIGPSTAKMDTNYDYQTGDLVTHRNFQSSFLSNVQFSRNYGIKASYFKKNFLAQYLGTGRFRDAAFVETSETVNDQIDYEAKYFGIGPRIGMGANWSLNRYFSIVGDVSTALLGGSYHSSWNEVLYTNGQINANIPNTSGVYAYNQATRTTLWSSLFVGSNLAIAANFDLKNGSSAGVQAGINTEQYWSQVLTDAFNNKRGSNTLYVNQRFGVRDLFVKFNYLC